MMSPSLKINLLGTFQLQYKDEPVVAFNGFPRLQSLLAYLVLYADIPQPRGHLAHLFWPSSSTTQARSNLRKLIYQLRRALPDADHFLTQKKSSIGWNITTDCWLDVTELNRSLTRMENEPFSRDNLERIAALYTGELLPLIYDDWAEPLRFTLQQAAIQNIEQLIRLLQNQQLYADAIPHAQKLLALTPREERRYRRVLELQHLAGDRQGGVQTYQGCIAMLQKNFGTEPGRETRMAYRRLTEAAPIAAKPDPLIPLVGRQNERERVQTVLTRSLRGQPHFAFISGEPGIGKTRLTEEILRWAQHQGIVTARTRSYTMQGGLALAALAQLLREDELTDRFSTLPDVWLTQIARLIPEVLEARPDLPKPDPVSEGWQRRQFYEALARAILMDNTPIILFFDDLQWLDVETLEWLHYLIRFDKQAKLLIIGTFRDNEVNAHHPLEKLRINLQRDDLLTDIHLRPLTESDTMALATAVSITLLAQPKQSSLYNNTQGNPLFIIETVRAKLGRQAGGKTAVISPDSTSMPAKMNAVIRSRLSILSTEAYDVIKIAASIGGGFDQKILAATSLLTAKKLAATLDELSEQRILVEEHPHRYDFSHDKIREVALTQTGSAQKRRLNLLIARAKETVYADHLEEMVGELAIHYELAGLLVESIAYYQQAANIEQSRGAYANGVTHLEKGLALLKQLPDPAAQMEQELAIQIKLGFAYMQTQGANSPAIEIAFNAAYQLCQKIEESASLFQSTYGLIMFYLARGNIQRMDTLSQQCLAIAQQSQDDIQLLAAHATIGLTAYFSGDFSTSNQHFSQTLTHYNLEQHAPLAAHFGQDLGCGAYSYWAFGLWFMGYPDQAMAKMKEAGAFAEQIDHVYTTANHHFYLLLLHIFNQDMAAARLSAQTVLDLSKKHELHLFMMQGRILEAWVRGMQTADNAQAIEEMEVNLRAIFDNGYAMSHPFGLNLLAQLHIGNADFDQATVILNEALTCIAKNGDRYFLADTHRLLGEATQHTHPQEAEQQFQQAISIANAQKAKTLQLRATMSLCRLYLTQGKQAQARRLLQPLYDWFTEGFDTVDRQQAKLLLAELREGS